MIVKSKKSVIEIKSVALEKYSEYQGDIINVKIYFAYNRGCCS
jgi:hypothetical protein